MPRERSSPRIIAVAGGKGGVGKSTVAANLALAFGRSGYRVVIVDADLGAANLHTMFGTLHPQITLAEFLDERVESLDVTLVRVAPTVELVPGTSRPGSANPTTAQKLRLLRGLQRIEADCIILDVGAGSSYTVVDLVAVADHKLVVVTPQLPSLHNAYALLKACIHRVVRRLTSDDTQRALIDAALGHELKARTLAQLLDVIRPLDPRFPDRVTGVLAQFGAGLVGNQLEGDGDSAALGRFGTLLHDQLGFHAPVLSTVPRSSGLAGALRAGHGTIAHRTDPSYPAFARLAQAVIAAPIARQRDLKPSRGTTMPLWIQRDALDLVVPPKGGVNG